jgi:hypothetical protein
MERIKDKDPVLQAQRTEANSKLIQIIKSNSQIDMEFYISQRERDAVNAARTIEEILPVTAFAPDDFVNKLLLYCSFVDADTAIQICRYIDGESNKEKYKRFCAIYDKLSYLLTFNDVEIGKVFTNKASLQDVVGIISSCVQISKDYSDEQIGLYAGLEYHEYSNFSDLARNRYSDMARIVCDMCYMPRYEAKSLCKEYRDDVVLTEYYKNVLAVSNYQERIFKALVQENVNIDLQYVLGEEINIDMLSALLPKDPTCIKNVYRKLIVSDDPYNRLIAEKIKPIVLDVDGNDYRFFESIDSVEHFLDGSGDVDLANKGNIREKYNAMINRKREIFDFEIDVTSDFEDLFTERPEQVMFSYESSRIEKITIKIKWQTREFVFDLEFKNKDLIVD